MRKEIPKGYRLRTTGSVRRCTMMRTRAMSEADSFVEELLAIDGGTPVRTAPYPAWPTFEDDEIQAVTNVLRSGRVNYHTGSEGREFEREFAEFTGSNHAIALANGTLALESALRALGVGPGDEVIVPPRTFIATASAVVAVGARPVCADVGPNDQNLTADTIAPVISTHTRAVIVVHLAGRPADMDPIVALCAQCDLLLIEDCAQALGATYKNRPVGSIGDAGAFSFCQDKIMTTGGEGGMVTFADESAYKRAWAYKDHGKCHDLLHTTTPTQGIGFRWLHESFGTNWRMTEMQSALGRVALRKVPSWVEQRRANAATLTTRLSIHAALRVPEASGDVKDAYYKFYAFVRPDALARGWDRDRIGNAILAEGVPCFSGSCSEIYLERAFTSLGYEPSVRLPVARELGETSLMFLVHHTAGAQEMRDAADAVDKVMEVASR